MGRYVVIGELGRGGMSEVFLARDTWLDRNVCLKMIPLEPIAEAAIRERFMAETRVLARFNHPGIISIYGVGEHAGRLYAALEFVDGHPLRDQISTKMPLAAAARIGLTIAAALSALHAQQILHGDLKPENVMINRNGTARLVDFGLADTFEDPIYARSYSSNIELALKEALGLARPEGYERRYTRELSGTPLYMAPEQWKQEPLSGATDIWALGLILYEVLSGTLPFDVSNACATSLCARVCSNIPLSTLCDRDDIPRDVGQFVDRCMNKKPKNRPTALEVVSFMERKVRAEAHRHKPHANELSVLRSPSYRAA